MSSVKLGQAGYVDITDAIDATNDIKAGDYLETYEVEERARTL